MKAEGAAAVSAATGGEGIATRTSDEVHRLAAMAPVVADGAEWHTADREVRRIRGHALLRETLSTSLGAPGPDLLAFGSARCDRLVRVTLQRIVEERA